MTATIEVIVGALHPEVGAVLAVADGAATLLLTFLIFGIVIFGREEQVKRIFRLLRWLANRAEPPAPEATRHRCGVLRGRAAG